MHSFNVLALTLLGAVEAGRPVFGAPEAASITTTTRAVSSSTARSSSIASISSIAVKAAGRPGFNAPQLPSTTTSTTAPAVVVGRPGFNAPKVSTTSTPSTTSSTSTTSSPSSTSTSSSKTTTSTSSSTFTTSSTSTSASTSTISSTSKFSTSTIAKTSTSTSSSTSVPTSTSTSTTATPTTTSIPTPTSSTTLITKTTSTSSAAAATCTSNFFQYGCLPLTNDAVFVSTMLAQHNLYRARHNAPAMTWSSTLAAAALVNAQNNANNNLFVHTPNNPNGENIAYQYGWDNPEYLGFLWYDEEKLFDFSNGGFADSTGHFTQLVWKSSVQLGCAYVQASNKLSNNGYYYLSCEYGPPGNYDGEYRDQVSTPNSQPYPTAPPQWL